MTAEDRLERTREIETVVEELVGLGWRRERVAIVDEEGAELRAFIRLSCGHKSELGGAL